MNDYIILLLIALFFCIWLTLNIKKSLTNTFSDFKLIKKENISIKKWRKVKAKILKKSFNTDYVYFDCEYEDIKDTINISEDEFIEQQNKNLLEKQINGNIEIYYGYMIDGKKYYSRSIGLLPSGNDVDLFYSLNKGDLTTAYVNNDDNADSFLRQTTDSEIDELEWNDCKGQLNRIVFCISLWILLIVGITKIL